MTGRVLQVNGNGGMIRRDDNGNQIRFLFADLPSGVRVKRNQGVDFEVGNDANGDKAINVRPSQQQQPPAVSWSLTKIVQPSGLKLGVKVTLKKGNNLAVGVTAKLYVNGSQATFPCPEPTTQADGVVEFEVGIPDTTVSYGLVLEVEQKASDLLHGLGAVRSDADGANGDAVEKAQLENAALKKTIGDLETRVTGLIGRVDELSKRAAPAKAALRAVEKGDDIGDGPRADAGVVSADDLEKRLAAMEPDARARLLMKAALTHPVPAIR
jgi:cold shock CspA family protein